MAQVPPCVLFLPLCLWHKNLHAFFSYRYAYGTSTTMRSFPTAMPMAQVPPCVLFLPLCLWHKDHHAFFSYCYAYGRSTTIYSFPTAMPMAQVPPCVENQVKSTPKNDNLQLLCLNYFERESACTTALPPGAEALSLWHAPLPSSPRVLRHCHVGMHHYPPPLLVLWYSTVGLRKWCRRPPVWGLVAVVTTAAH